MEELEAILETSAAAAVAAAASALAERGGTPPDCPNCRNPLIGPYCAVCGQPLNTHRRSLRHLIGDFIKDIASFDSRILRTARALLLRPGELPTAFREGRTQPYVPAVRLYLFVTLLFFLFLSATGIAIIQFNLEVAPYRLVHDSAGNVYKVRSGERLLMEGFKSDTNGKVRLADSDAADLAAVDMTADGKTKTELTTRTSFFQRIPHAKAKPSAELEKALKDVKIDIKVNDEKAMWTERAVYGTLDKLREDPAALNGPLTTWIPRILFVLLPLFAALLALFYRKKRKEYYFVDHLVFSLTMHSFAFMLLIGAALAAQILVGSWVAWATWLLLSVYFYLSLKIFYRQGWVRTGFKFVGISLVYALFFLAPALGFAIIASVLEG